MEIKTVNFLGSNLLAAKDDSGQVWAGVSHICKGIGLNKNQKDNQTCKVQNDKILKNGVSKFDAGVFDPNNETIGLKLEFIPLWLAKISITPNMKKNQADVADRLLQYQLKVKDVLADAFTSESNKNISYRQKCILQFSVLM